jgi:hypothetical protein
LPNTQDFCALKSPKTLFPRSELKFIDMFSITTPLAVTSGWILEKVGPG